MGVGETEAEGVCRLVAVVSGSRNPGSSRRAPLQAPDPEALGAGPPCGPSLPTPSRPPGPADAPHTPELPGIASTPPARSSGARLLDPSPNTLAPSPHQSPATLSAPQTLIVYVSSPDGATPQFLNSLPPRCPPAPPIQEPRCSHLDYWPDSVTPKLR